MIIKYKHVFLIVLLTILGLSFVNAQEQEQEKSDVNEKLYKKIQFYDLRGTNAVDFAVGASLISGGLPNPESELYFRLGYKRHVTEHLGISFSYNKYNLAFNEIYNEGFMSFDLNLEYFMSPYTNVSPFVYGGYGYNAANYFENTGAKVQGGLGIEFIVAEKLGVKLFGEYNHVFSDEANPIILGENSISLLRVGVGIHLYFGGKKKRERLLEEVETVIQSNYIK